MVPYTVVSKRSAVVITALRVEYEAVRAWLEDFREVVHPSGTVYEQGSFTTGNISWEIAIAEIGPGAAGAAYEAERAIRHFMPHVVFFVGIAGGIKDVKIGDVVAATKIYGYESGKDSRTFLPRPSVGESTYPMVQRARIEAKKTNFLKRINELGKADPPRVYVGPLAAGEKVVGSNRSATARFLRQNYSDALAVEMEGRGFAEAAHANHRIESLVIRGISDLLDKKSLTDLQGGQELASRNAAAFFFSFLDGLSQGNQVDAPEYIPLARPITSFNFDLLHYSVAIQILDDEGKRALYEKRSRIRVANRRARSYADDLYSEGRIEGVSAIPGRADHVIVDGRRYLVLTRFDEELEYGRELDRVLRCEFVDSFIGEQNYWLFTPPSPTDYLEISIRFPKTRLCQSYQGFLWEDDREVPHKPGPNAKRQGKKVSEIHWRIERPQLQGRYKLIWWW
jgi:nucleoside phosphorylase